MKKFPLPERTFKLTKAGFSAHSLKFSLAKGATCEAHCDKFRRVAFTLAEVLITLGIIGVVAAFTLPPLVTNYQKKQTVTQLKKVYTTLSQAFEHAKADYGDISTWELENSLQSTATANREKIATDFSQKYLTPYLSKTQDMGFISTTQFGYDKIYNIDGSTASWLDDTSSYMLMLSDRTPIGIKTDAKNIGTAENPNRIIWAIFIWTDLNGIKGPNVVGHDIFLFKLNLSQNAQFMPYYYSTTSALSNCQQGDMESRCCTGLIMLDGWEIKAHYPWTYKH